MLTTQMVVTCHTTKDLTTWDGTYHSVMCGSVTKNRWVMYRKSILKLCRNQCLHYTTQNDIHCSFILTSWIGWRFIMQVSHIISLYYKHDKYSCVRIEMTTFTSYTTGPCSKSRSVTMLPLWQRHHHSTAIFSETLDWIIRWRFHRVHEINSTQRAPFLPVFCVCTTAREPVQ